MSWFKRCDHNFTNYLGITEDVSYGDGAYGPLVTTEYLYSCIKCGKTAWSSRKPEEAKA